MTDGLTALRSVVGEAEVRHHAGAVVLDHHVGRPHELEEGLATVGLRHVDAHAALVAVHLVEVHRAVVRLALQVLERADPEQRSRRRTRRPLDLDAVGAEVGEEAAADRPGPVRRHLDDPQPLQRRAAALRHGGGRRPPGGRVRRRDPAVLAEARRRTASAGRRRGELVGLPREGDVALALPPVARRQLLVGQHAGTVDDRGHGDARGAGRARRRRRPSCPSPTPGRPRRSAGCWRSTSARRR